MGLFGAFLPMLFFLVVFSFAIWTGERPVNCKPKGNIENILTLERELYGVPMSMDYLREKFGDEIDRGHTCSSAIGWPWFSGCWACDNEMRAEAQRRSIEGGALPVPAKWAERKRVIEDRAAFKKKTEDDMMHFRVKQLKIADMKAKAESLDHKNIAWIDEKVDYYDILDGYGNLIERYERAPVTRKMIRTIPPEVNAAATLNDLMSGLTMTPEKVWNPTTDPRRPSKRF